MGRFFADFGTPSALPVVGGSALPSQSPSRPGSVVRASPARPFGPAMIRPEYVGAPVAKPIIPPYADQQTINSLAPPTSARGVMLSPTSPRGATSSGSSAQVQRIFNSVAQQKAARVANSVTAAQTAQARANELQVQAAAAAHTAAQAQGQAQMNPHPAVQQQAQQAQAQANVFHNAWQRAQKSASQQWTRVSIDTAQAQATGGGGAGDVSDLPPTYDPEEAVPWTDMNPAPSSGHPYVVAAGAAGVGFLVGGPVGALIGLLGGGAYAYRQAQADAQAAAAAQAQLVAPVQPSGGAAAMASLRGYRW